MTRVLRLLAAVAGVCCAQTFEMRGTVTEPGLGGIAGAEVSVISRATGQLASPDSSVKAYTNARGEFAVRLPKEGTYTASAKLDGYFASRFSSIGGVVDADHPVMEARLEMLRFAEMTGRVVDAETGEPVRGIAVQPVQRSVALDGSKSWNPAVPTEVSANPTAEASVRALVDRFQTDANGVFRFQGLRPGSYVAAVFSLEGSGAQTKYSPEEAKVIETEYERVYWPGGLAPDAAVPQEVGSGGIFHVGDIRLKKVPSYRVHVRISQGDCPEGESVRVSVLQRNLAPGSVGVFPCGSDALLRGFEPGAYTLYAVSDWQGERDNVEAAVWATAPFAITKENAEVTLEPRHGVVLKGRIVAGDGIKEAPTRIPLTVRPGEIVEGSRPAMEEFIEWGENGDFRVAVGSGPQTLFGGRRVLGDMYVGKVFYNGSAARDLTFDAQPGESQHLELVVENKFGFLEGSVERFAGGTVALWQKDDSSPLLVSVNANGTFQMKIPPGEYRIVVTQNAFTQVRLAAAAETDRVVVKSGETTKVTLKGSK